MKANKILLFLGGVLGVWLSMVAAAGAAEQSERPFLHPLFSDHVVLQRHVKVPVWGWSTPGATVTVTFGKQSKVTIAQPDGRWSVRLDSMHASVEAQELRASSSERSVTIHDVVVGDVWLCSGQSNMEMGIGACNATTDIAQADFPQIRLLTVPHLIAMSPVETVACQWSPCNPVTVLQGGWGGFSAAGFFFGRELNQQLKVPIGLILSSWGGTIAEAWTSADALKPLVDFDDRLKAVSKLGTEKPADFAAEYAAWAERNDPGTQQGWFNQECETSNWKTVTMPQPFEQAGLPDFDGIVWFRRTIELPADWAGQKLTLGLGPVDDIDTTWVNGVKVGQMNRHDLNRVYRVPAEVAKAGANVISVRVLDTGGAGGFTGKPEQMFIRPGAGGQVQSLAGEWQMRDSVPLAKLPAPPTVPDANNPNVVAVLYNGMIAPLLPFAIKGAIWYQGESNAPRAEQYRKLLPAMIEDWRAHFGVGDFPFYIVQLAAFQPVAPDPRESEWAELREAQALTARKVPRSGLAVAIDIGDAADIHPKNKAEVGRRLALCALANTYEKPLAWSGPWYKGMKKSGNKIRLSFDHVDGGLAAKGSDLQGFAIAGEDHKFIWASAAIENNTVVVSSPEVPHPVAVRYGWDINPVCNLYNQAGLPAVPFRTDDWPMVTKDRK